MRSCRQILLLPAVALVACTTELKRDLDAGDLRGHVVTLDAGREHAVEGARVWLLGSRLGAITDADGNFTLKGLSEGTYDLRIDRPPAAQGDVALASVIRGVAILTPGSTVPGRDLSTIVIGAPGEISGTVTGGESPRLGVVGWGETRIESSGKYRAIGVPAGPWAVAVIDAAGKSAVKQVVVDSGKTVTADLAPTDAQSTASLSGTARIFGKTSHDLLTVTLEGSGDPVPVGETDRGGVFAGSALSTGLFTLVVRDTDGASVALPAVPVGPDVVLPDLLLTAVTACGAIAHETDDLDRDGKPDISEPPECRCDPTGWADADVDHVCDGADLDDDDDDVPDVNEPSP